MEELRKECLELFWPFPKAGYETQRGKAADLQLGVGWREKMGRQIRVIARDGVLQRGRHNSGITIIRVVP